MNDDGTDYLRRDSFFVTEAEFVKSLEDALLQTGRFSTVTRESVVNGIYLDIVAEEAPTGLSASKTWVFEVKNRSLATADIIRSAFGLREIVKTQIPDSQFVLIVLGKVSAGAKTLARGFGLTVIDLASSSAESTPGGIEGILIEALRSLAGTPPADSKVISYATALERIEIGTPGWVKYQKLCIDILEYLFCPPLDSPRYENPDASRRNRRDMIFPNNVEGGFWENLRRTYAADYVVADTKNYSHKLQKKPVLDIAHYLKPYGCGMFGVLVSRRGAGPSAVDAAKEQWISGKKMIISISDADLVEMLSRKAAGTQPEEVLKQKIDDFRISL